MPPFATEQPGRGAHRIVPADHRSVLVDHAQILADRALAADPALDLRRIDLVRADAARGDAQRKAAAGTAAAESGTGGNAGDGAEAGANHRAILGDGLHALDAAAVSGDAPLHLGSIDVGRTHAAVDDAGRGDRVGQRCCGSPGVGRRGDLAARRQRFEAARAGPPHADFQPLAITGKLRRAEIECNAEQTVRHRDPVDHLRGTHLRAAGQRVVQAELHVVAGVRCAARLAQLALVSESGRQRLGVDRRGRRPEGQ